MSTVTAELNIDNIRAESKRWNGNLHTTLKYMLREFGFKFEDDKNPMRSVNTDFRPLGKFVQWVEAEKYDSVFYKQTVEDN